MPRSADEMAMVERFDQQYLRGQADVMRAIERSVCGCDYGGTSWTTRSEADEVCRLLSLSPDKHLLDVGAGSGWPALYFARNAGCRVTLVDVPFNGIHVAAERAAAELSDSQCRMAVGDGGALPFKNQSFDAISHSDVLCCLPGKADVQRECRRVVREHGGMAFTVIFITPGLSSKRKAAAVEFGPPYVESECSYPEMLEKTGWRITQSVDLTAEFTSSVRKFIGQWRENEASVWTVVGRDDYDAILTRQSGKLQVLEDGGLCRQLYAAVPA